MITDSVDLGKVIDQQIGLTLEADDESREREVENLRKLVAVNNEQTRIAYEADARADDRDSTEKIKEKELNLREKELKQKEQQLNKERKVAIVTTVISSTVTVGTLIAKIWAYAKGMQMEQTNTWTYRTKSVVNQFFK